MLVGLLEKMNVEDSFLGVCINRRILVLGLSLNVAIYKIIECIIIRD
jgi:hypothetical protein